MSLRQFFNAMYHVLKTDIGCSSKVTFWDGELRYLSECALCVYDLFLCA